MKKKQLFFSKIPILRIMKIYLVLLCITFSKIFANEAYSQNITLNAENVKIKRILTEIEHKSDFSFFYNSSIINVSLKKTLTVENIKIDEALNLLFNNTNIDYSFVRNQIILFPKDKPELKLKIERILDKADTTVTTSINSDKVDEYIKSILQTRVSGQVVDANGNPLPGVTVLVKGTSTGTSTDFDGNYTLNVEDPNGILVFSYIGFSTQEVSINNQGTINVTLEENTAQLEEVVIVGYGAQKKVNLTGSIATVKSTEIVKNNSATLTSGLAGRLAGVTTIQSSGEPGSDGSSFRIRGLSSINDGGPLVLVDGIPRSMNDVNPHDVESISVLKDAAAAAIYGMRAGNGVVLITTKRGKSGKSTFNVSLNSGIQKVTRLTNFLDSYDYATLLNEANANDGVPAAYTDADLELFRNGSSPDTHPNTDWFDESLKSFSQMRSINVSGSGASENDNFRYFSSLGYLFQDALYDNNKFERFNFRTNLDIKINDRIRISTDFAGDMEDRERPGIDAGTIFSNLYRTPPTEVNKWSNGEYSSFSILPSINSGGFNRSRSFELQSKVALDIDFGFLEGLNLYTQVAYDYFGSRSKSFNVPNTYTIFDASANTFTESTGASRGETANVSESYNNSFNLTIESILSYNKSIENHDFGAKLVFSKNNNSGYDISASIQNLLGTTTPFFIAGDAETRAISNGETESARLGYAGRFTYAFKDKYLVEFNGRYDGSYKFAPGSKYGFFPSVSFAWKAHKEGFLKDSNVINNLKIRGSYGELGSDSGIGAFRYLQFFGFSSAFVDDQTVVQTIASNGLEDKSTTWEKAKTYNLGIELGLWNNLVSLETDIFYKRTSDVLSSRNLQVPATLGAQLPVENFGIIDNRGFEVVLKHQNTIKDFDYFTNLNFSFSKNEIVDLAEAEDVDPLRRRTGRALNTRFGLIADGIFLTQQEIDDLDAAAPSGSYQEGGASPGDIRYVDVNGDGEVNSDDRTVIGKGNIPEVTFGLNLGLNYKQFDFSALFQGATNFNVYLQQEAAYAFFNGGKVFDRHLGRAQIGTDGNVINPNASYPRITLNDRDRNERTSSYWVEDGDYLRLKNIEIGYTLPERISSKMGVSSFRVYTNGRNLVTWSKLKHIDPENPQTRGRFYPQQKVWSLGLNVTF